jgi:hypothetical protein
MMKSRPPIALFLLMLVFLTGQLVLAQDELPEIIDFDTIVAIPEDIREAVINVFQQEPDLASSSERFVASAFHLRENGGDWAEITLVPYSIFEDGFEGTDTLESLVRVFAYLQSDGSWLAFRENSLLPGALNEGVIPHDFLEPLLDAEPLSNTHLFPWTNGQNWFKTQGWHSGALDFQPVLRTNPAVHYAVLASAAGRLRQVCNDGTQAMYEVEHSGGLRSGYLHMASNSLRGDLVGKNVDRGQFMGLLYDVGGGYHTNCGRGDAVHLHYVAPSQNMTINGHNINNVANAEFATQYQSTNVRVDNNSNPSQPSGNLLSNPGFEQHMTSWQFSQPGNGVCAWTTEYGGAREGSRMLSTNRPSNNNCLSIFQDVNVTPQSGETYTFAIWGKRAWDGAIRRGSVALWTMGSNQQTASEDFIFDGGWQCAQVKLNVDRNGNNQIRAEVYLDNVGHPDYQFDSFQLVRGNVNLCTATNISSHPVNVTQNTGNNATFSVVATGVMLQYQWQSRSSNGEWQNISGATQSTYTINTVSQSNNGTQYRVIVRGNAGNLTSNSAMLTVQNPATPTPTPLPVNDTVITIQPQNVSVTEPEPATFTVLATGDNLSYQWQQFAGGAWADVSGATSDTLTFNPTGVLMNGLQVRVVVTGDGGIVTSDSATLTIVSPANETIITVQPQDVSVTEPEPATFTVSATGDNLSYQWQQFAGGAWVDISGSTGTSLTLAPTGVVMTGLQVRVVVTGDGGVVESNIATLTINPEEEPVPDTVACRVLSAVGQGQVVGIAHIQAFASRYGASVGDPNYDPAFDLTGSGVIGIASIQQVASSFGQSCS